jgi:hypothetical protein
VFFYWGEAVPNGFAMEVTLLRAIGVRFDFSEKMFWRLALRAWGECATISF